MRKEYCGDTAHLLESTRSDGQMKNILSEMRVNTLEETTRPIQQVTRTVGVVRVVHREEIPAEMEWHTMDDPRRLRRIIQLHDTEIVKFFVGELLAYEDQFQHRGKIVIEGTKVTLEVYTHDVNDITNSDRAYAESVDLIYADALELFNRRNMLAARGPCGQWP